MDLYKIKNVEENFGELRRNYPELSVKAEMEKGKESNHLWGANLSLSLIETIKYCQKTDDFLVPSSALFAQIFLECLKNKEDPNASKIIQDLNNYWIRTMSIIVFPSENSKGYIVHYPNIDGNELVRKQGKIEGDFVIEFDDSEMPPFGQIAFLNKHASFFGKLLGKNTAQAITEYVEKEYGYTPSIWIPPEVSIQASPERLVLFGGFVQYGQGLWLTSNSADKTIVGTRPFKGVFLK